MTNEEMMKKIEMLENENKALVANANKANNKYDHIVEYIFNNRSKHSSNRSLAKAIAKDLSLCTEASAFHYLSMQRYVDAYVKYELANS